MIKLRNISKKFNNLTLFENFNLDIPLNQLTFIVGNSGAGKTTLLNIIGGLEAAKKDETILIELKNRFIYLKDKKNRYLIDFVFQDFNLFPELNSLDNIKLGKNVLGQKFNKFKTIKLLENFGINKEVYLEKVKNLSIGEMQRIAIIRAISRDSRVLLVDEPTANLDEENSKIVFELLKKISKTKTVIVVSHDTENAISYGNNVILLENNNAKYIKQFDKEKQIIVDETLNQFVEHHKTESKILSFSNKLKVAPKLAFIELRKKWVSFLLILISMFITIFTLLTVLNFAIGNPRIFGNINQTQYDKITLSKTNGEVIGDNETKYFKNSPNVEKLVDQYNIKLLISYNQNNINTTSNNKALVLNYRQIDESDFFKNRIIVGNEIDGSFLQNENEIIISKELIKELNISNPIGKTVQIKYNYATESSDKNTQIVFTPITKDLKIVGINNVLNNSSNDKNKGFSYLDSSLLKKIKEEIISKNKLPSEFSFAPFNSDKKYETINNVKITQQEINQANISAEYTKINPQFSKYYVYISTAIAQQITKNPDVNNLRNIRYTTTVNGQQNVVFVAGSFNSNLPEIKIKPENYEFLTKIRPDSLDVYYKPYFNIKKDVDHIKTNPVVPYQIVNYDQILRDIIFKNTTTFYIVGTIVIAIFSVLAVLFSLVFSKIIVSSKKKQIGILKSLGSTKLQTYLYHITNMLALSFVSYILILALYYPLYFLIGTFTTFFALSIPNPYQLFLWMFLIWIAFTFVVIASYSIISLLTIRKPFKKLMS